MTPILSLTENAFYRLLLPPPVSPLPSPLSLLPSPFSPTPSPSPPAQVFSRAAREGAGYLPRSQAAKGELHPLLPRGLRRRGGGHGDAEAHAEVRGQARALRGEYAEDEFGEQGAESGVGTSKNHACDTQRHGLNPVYTRYTPLFAAYAPMCTHYTCFHTIYTSYIHLTHLLTPRIRPKYALNTPKYTTA